MRTERELINLICDQVTHWINKCGREMDEYGELVDEAMDMILTDDEAMAYPRLRERVRMSLVY